MDLEETAGQSLLLAEVLIALDLVVVLGDDLRIQIQIIVKTSSRIIREGNQSIKEGEGALVYTGLRNDVLSRGVLREGGAGCRVRDDGGERPCSSYQRLGCYRC